MDVNSASDKSLLLSYLTLRKAVGILGLSFPFVLAIGAWVLFGTGLQKSISAYYHTGMGDVFVGTLCVIGLFLFSYKGHERADDLAGDLGCMSAVGVALFPTTPENAGPDDPRWVGTIHLVFAALLFLTLIYFSLFLFRKTSPSGEPTRKKLQRNTVYKACGYIMIACIVMIPAVHLLPDGVAASIEGLEPVFWLEAGLLVAFGVSWLTKGEAILKDAGGPSVSTRR